RSARRNRGRESVPTRRSSDLGLRVGFDGVWEIFEAGLDASENHGPAVVSRRLLNGLGVIIHELLLAFVPRRVECRFGYHVFVLRSEEHTSELQSRGHLVCGRV